MDIEMAKALFAMLGIDPLANINEDDVRAIAMRVNPETKELEVAVIMAIEGDEDTVQADLVAEAERALAGGQA